MSDPFGPDHEGKRPEYIVLHIKVERRRRPVGERLGSWFLRLDPVVAAIGMAALALTAAWAGSVAWVIATELLRPR